MRKSLRFLVMVLSVLMAVSMLAACSNATNSAAPSSAAVTAAGSSVAASSAAATAEPTAAPTKTPDPAQLTWYYGGTQPNNYDAVMAELNKQLQAKINVTLQFKITDFGDFSTKMQTVMASGEKFDLCFTTGGWVNNFLPAVTKGAFLPLNNYLNDPQYATLKGSMPSFFWDDASYKGQIYAVPNQQVEYDQDGVWMKKDLVDKYNIDVTKIKQLSDFTPIFETIKKNEPGIIPVSGQGYNGGVGFESLYDQGIFQLPIVPLYIDTNTWKVIDGNTIQANLDDLKIMRQWNQDGFFPSDIATLTDETALMQAGKIFCQYSVQKPGNEAELKNTYGYDVVCIPTGPKLFYSGTCINTATAISQTSQHPDQAFALLNLFNTDSNVYNMASWGLPDQDYTVDSSNANRITPKQNAYNLYNWELGCVFNSFLIPGQTDDVWTQTKAANDESIPVPINGFQIDQDKIQTQISQMDAVNQQYGPILGDGLADPAATMPKYEAALKSAGIDDVIKEVQSQLDAWRSANGK